MKSNFEFLKNKDDLQKYYANAVNAERLYADGYYLKLPTYKSGLVP